VALLKASGRIQAAFPRRETALIRVALQNQDRAGLDLAGPLDQPQLHQVVHQSAKRVVARPVILRVKLLDAALQVAVNGRQVISSSWLDSFRFPFFLCAREGFPA
jgi:hypothetical protein